ncbi:hypothetical protein L0P88_21585 [Muricauda sp. SCSIO 64092]|uniref:hypothetical protein n=1 Tax=Allomuricauda sp. SCSIO 64092 TaxID=2908842 RepID=UPI001FF4F6F0|nr:hypothetical protein [Muricauda sp. SCSIO 64092]UOY06503.1 hypothetical protein L0P88_21585 [Muricauda sp. SCSIO 64092]
MKRHPFIFVLLLVAMVTKNQAQTTIETFSDTDGMIIEAWFFKPLTEDYKFTIFSLNDAVIDYDSETAEFVSYTVLGYDAWKGFGPVLGGRVFDGRTSALAGIQWNKAGEGFLITTNITSEVRDAPLYEWYLLTQYRFPLNQKLGFFGQFQNSTNFDGNGHLFSFQRLRVGLSMKTLQFGLGLTTYQFGNDGDFEADPGIFVRLEF